MNAVRAIATLDVDTYRRGGRAMIAAPALAAIVVLPEAAQHVVEIHLGMFDSAAAFRAHAFDPLRMVFGVMKIVGLMLAILTIMRFQAVSSIRGALAIPVRAWLKMVAVCAVTVLLAIALAALGRSASSTAINAVLGLVSIVVQLAGMYCLAAAALDDPLPTPRGLGERIPAMIVTTLLLAVAFTPAQLLHMADHRLIVGQPTALVVAVLAFDALVVGLLAALIGSALFLGYRSALTWRGWGEAPPVADATR